MTNKIKILFVLDCLEGGGAQRMTINLIRHLSRKKFKIQLSVIKKRGPFVDLIPDDIEVFDLQCRAAKYAIFKLIRVIKENKPDLIFSNLTYINELTYLALRFFKNAPPVIMRSTILESINIKVESFLTRVFIKKAYRSASKIIVMTEVMKNDFIENYGIKKEKIEIIQNPLDMKAIQILSGEEVIHRWFKKDRICPVITAMGRLENQKGFEYLIKALKNLTASKLVILGEGKLRSELEDLTKELGIDVQLIGFKKNPYKYIAKSDVFVLSSLWEGFPNALIEAMACRVPVIATDCPSGPAEIITSGLNGILVPLRDVAELAKAIEKVLNDTQYRINLGNMGFERVKEFDICKIVSQYEACFMEIVTKKRIFHLITSLNIGGTEHILQNIISGTRNNYKHYVGYIKEYGEIGKNLVSSGIPVEFLPSIFKIIEHVRRIKPAIIHTHLYRANILGRIVGKVCGIPVISSQQSIDLWRKWYHIKLDALTARWCSKIVANSVYTSKLIEEQEKIASEKIEVVYAGLAEDWYIKENLYKKEKIIGFVGRLHTEKGADLIPEFANKLYKNDNKIKIKIVSGGPLDQYLADNIPGNCEMLGWIEENNLKQFYDSIDVLILLSREESFPMVILEAAARGVPAIAPDVGGIREFVVEGKTGFLFKKGDLNEACEKVVRYLNSNRKGIAENVLNRARQFPKEKMIRQILDIYRSIT